MIIIKYFLNQWGEKNAYSIKKKKQNKNKVPLVPSKSQKFFLQKSLWLEGEGGNTGTVEPWGMGGAWVKNPPVMQRTWVRKIPWARK